MKTFIYDKYDGPDCLEFADIPVPVPKAGEVLIKVEAASVNARDWRLLAADPFLVRLMGGGFLRPKYRSIGSDIAGTVEATGKGVTRFKTGDSVFGDISGAGFGGGGFAEFVCAPESALAEKPEDMTFEQAAAIPMAAITALQGLRDAGQVRQGERVAINGASGGVGTFAVQLAKALGAEVTAVCSAGKMDLARSLGADEVIDYTVADFTLQEGRYDLILAANGFRPIRSYFRALKEGGRYVMAGGKMAQLFQALILGPSLSKSGSKKLQALSARPSADDLAYIAKLFQEGKLKPVIDRRYPLAELPDAIRYVQEGHAAGKVIIGID